MPSSVLVSPHSRTIGVQAGITHHFVGAPEPVNIADLGVNQQVRICAHTEECYQQHEFGDLRGNSLDLPIDVVDSLGQLGQLQEPLNQEKPPEMVNIEVSEKLQALLIPGRSIVRHPMLIEQCVNRVLDVGALLDVLLATPNQCPPLTDCRRLHIALGHHVDT